jgi:hypothetical protein
MFGAVGDVAVGFKHISVFFISLGEASSSLSYVRFFTVWAG